MQRLAYSVQVKQGLDLSIDRQEERVIYSNASSCVLFYDEVALTEK